MRAGPGQIPIVLAVALFTAGVFFSVRLEQGVRRPVALVPAASALEAPRLRIRYRTGRLELGGTAGSPDHESALLQLIEDQFGAARARVDLRPGVVLPAGWETTSLRLLHALAATSSGSALMEHDRVEIRGVTSNEAALTQRLRLLRESIPPGVAFENDFIVVEESVSLSELCRTSLANASRHNVGFRLSSAELRTASHAALDKIIEVANDCRSKRIAITGHSDASGDETWNRHLSLARAQAVAEYMILRGIDSDRLIVAGSGSSRPIADNSTARGRSLNRRIEFEFR